MAINKLSEPKIRKLKFDTNAPKKVADGGGLSLVLRENGSKLWQYNYRFNGRYKTMSLGAWPVIDLDRARELHREAKRSLAEGVDPMEARKEVKSRAESTTAITWSFVVEKFLAKKQRDGAKEATITKNRWLFDFTIEAFGHRPVKDLTTADFRTVLETLAEAGSLHSAARLRSLCDSLYDYAIVFEYADRNPVKCLRSGFNTKDHDHKNHPSITNRKEVGGLIRTIRSYTGSAVTKLGLLLLAYTFLRPGEVRHARWSDVDWERKEIIIPAERMKSNRDHIVPLSSQVLSILKAAKLVTGGRDLIVGSLTRKDRPLSENTFNAALRTMGFTKEQMTAHGFRTTASTLLNEDDFNSDWIERQLAHVEGNKVRSAYNRAKYLEGRKGMMQAWSDTLDDLSGSPTPDDPMKLFSRG
ncbi:MAG: tyrosine-type recombinase/integrase [Pseudomonadota bacterium]